MSRKEIVVPVTINLVKVFDRARSGARVITPAAVMSKVSSDARVVAGVRSMESETPSVWSI